MIAFKKKLKSLGVSAEEAWEEIERIRGEQGGLLSPASLVEVAEDSGHIFHSVFEWDDTEAASRWRIHQAREFVRNLEVVVEDRTAAPAMVSVVRETDDGAKRRGYMPAAEAMQDESLRRQVMKRALSQVLALEKRYRSLAELGGVWGTARRIAEDLELRELL